MNAGKSFLTLRSHSFYRILDLFRQERSYTDCCMSNVASVLTEESPPYRFNSHPPFDSVTGSLNGIKGNQVKYSKPKKEPSLAMIARPSRVNIAVLRRAQRRMIQWAIASTQVAEACALVQSAVEVFNMEQRLLGREPLPSKTSSKRSKSTPVSIPDFPMPDSGTQSVPTPIAKPASESQPPAADDTPF